MTLVPLPPRSPGLNPIERVWLSLKQRSHRVFEDYDAILEAACAAWTRRTGEPAPSPPSPPTPGSKRCLHVRRRTALHLDRRGRRITHCTRHRRLLGHDRRHRVRIGLHPRLLLRRSQLLGLAPPQPKPRPRRITKPTVQNGKLFNW